MSLTGLTQKFGSSIKVAFQATALLWIIQLLQYLLGFEWGYLGIFPRTDFGLRGILFAPLLHANWEHLIANSPPLFVLLAMILFFYRKVAFSSIAVIYLLTGVAVWAFGRSVFHIGASGVIYGLVAFVFWTGVFRRNLKSIALALLVGFYYGSMFLGILPNQPGISWESHLLGALAGIFAAFLFKDAVEKDEERQVPSWEHEPAAPEQFLFDRDLFDKTKQEREKEKAALRDRQDGVSGWFSNRS